MDIGIYLLAGLPFAVVLTAKLFLHTTINWQEWAVCSLLGVLIAVGVYHGGRLSQASATEIWNGEVDRVYARKESCPMGWRSYRDSFCEHYRTRQVYVGQQCTGTGDNRVCRPKYETEYNYDYPWEQKFFVDLNLKNRTLRIRNVDPQGRTKPPRWLEANVGDPASITNDYQNWIRPAANSLFSESQRTAKLFAKQDLLPDYPNEIYDYYKVDRIIEVETSIPNEDQWNKQLANVLAELGPNLGMNAIFVFVDAEIGQKYADALRFHWQGFQKNDVVITVGLNGKSVSWVNVDSWSKNDLFNVKLRDAIRKEGTLHRDHFMGHLHAQALANFERRPMEEFEYLKAEMPTPTWVWILAVVLGLLLPGGLLYVFHQVDFDPIGHLMGRK